VKRIKQLLFVCFTLTLLTAFPPAKADDRNDNGKTTGGASGTNNSGTSLPINNDIIFLFVTGAAIGCKVITDKIKSARQQKLNKHE
jgi:hypothetical protein